MRGPFRRITLGSKVSVDPADLHRRIAAALARIEVVTRAQGQQAAQGANVSPLQVRVLDALARRPGLRVGELAHELLVTDGTVSAAVTVLVEKGLVVKQRDEGEHRAVLLELSARGRRQHMKLAEWPDVALAPVVEDLGEAASGAVLAALLQVIQSFERRGWIEATRMCVHCEYFAPGKGRGAQPHYCHLLEQPIGSADLQVDCPDFRTATAEVIEARRRALAR